jgi:hypothetical protein
LSTAAHWVKKRITLTLEKLVPFSSGYGILSRGRSLLEHDFEDLDSEDLRNLVKRLKDRLFERLKKLRELLRLQNAGKTQLR